MGALRKWFGPSKADVWKQLSDQLGGAYDEGGFLKSDKVRVAHGLWIVTLDVFVVSNGATSVPYTRLRAPYVNPDGFRFNIYRTSIFTGLGKFFGMQDVEIGIEGFDEDFVIKGNDEAKLRALLTSPSMRSLLESQPKVGFCVRDDEGWFGTKFPEGVDELSFIVPGIIKDVDRLEQLFNLFAETLDQLCRIGSAYEADPQVVL